MLRAREDPEINRFAHELGKSWGVYMRKEPLGWPSKSLMGRIEEEGSVGAAIKSHYQKVPVNLMPAQVQEFHRAWLTLRESQRISVFVAYVIRAPYALKAERLGLSRSRYYQLRDLGLSQIGNRIGNS